MKFKSFIWDEHNIAHIAEHSVTPDEAEEACYNKPIIFKTRMERYLVLGKTSNGRYLTVIILPKDSGIARVITARDMTISERQRFQRR